MRGNMANKETAMNIVKLNDISEADLTPSVLGNGSGSDPINRSNPLWTVTFEQPGFRTQCDR